jgi:hypothetical protein
MNICKVSYDARSAVAGLACLLFAAATMTGCAESTSTTAGAPKEYRPPRVETTGSLISHAVVAHVDGDDDDDDQDVAHRQHGANSVTQMLNGSSAAAGTRVGQ